VIETRLEIDTAGHYSRPDIFTLDVDVTHQAGVRFKGDS